MGRTVRDAWFLLRVQPEPWRTPPHGVGRKAGKLFVTSGSDEQLVTYQNTIRDLMNPLVPSPELFLDNKYPVKLTLYYWRKLGKGIAHADVTNLNKALEDALQGILYENDRMVQNIKGVIVAQHAELECEPKVLIHLEDGHGDEFTFTGEFPQHVVDMLVEADWPVSKEEEDDLSWPPTR